MVAPTTDDSQKDAPPDTGLNAQRSAQELNSQPFINGTKLWRDKGWLGTIPLPAKAKNPPPIGWTGRSASFPDDDQISEWCDGPAFGHGNLGLHLGWPVLVDGVEYEVLGIDVDHYLDGNRQKLGGDQLTELESQLGELPPTWVSTARAANGDWLSGIRFFLVPRGLAFRGSAAADIEIIQRNHRFAVVWPSFNPKTETTYELYSPMEWIAHGQAVTELPEVTELPMLPDRWIDYLTQGRMRDSQRPIDTESSLSELESWALNQFQDSETLCDVMARRLSERKAEIDTEATSHDKVRDAHYEFVRMALEGHTGWLTAINEVPEFWIQDVTARDKREFGELRREIFRSLTGALRKAKAENGSEHYGKTPCECSDSTVEQSITSVSDDPISAANRDFWSTRPELTAIYDFAKCRRIGPWGLLGVAMTRALASIPPEVVLPPILGSEASLNFYLALVGVSGGSKTVAIDAGESFIETTPHVDSVMPGTGEGLAKQFAYVRGATRNNPPQQIGVRYAALLTVDEIGTLTALAERSGQTIMPTLRSAWSGADLGFGNGDPTKSPRIYRHRFRLALVMGVQPDHAGPIFAEATLGTPQRFLWMPTHDDDTLGYGAEVGAEPAPLVLPPYPELSQPNKVVAAGGIGDRVALLNTPIPARALRRLEVPEIARREVLEAHEKRSKMGNWMRSDVVLQSMPTDIDGHLMLMREKVAVALMRLAGRDGGFTEQDWHLAGVVMSVSNYTRERMQYLRSQRAKQETHGKATRAADFETAKVARMEANADEIAKIADRILNKLETKDGLTTNRLFKDMFDGNSRTADKRQLFDAAIRHLVANQRAKIEDFIANTGTEATKVWLA